MNINFKDNHLDYPFIIMDVLDRVVAPCINTICLHTLESTYNEDAYTKALELMESYPHYEFVKEYMFSSQNTLQLDISESIYLLNKIMPDVIKVYKITPRDARNLLHIRAIRNIVVHNNSIGKDKDGRIEKAYLEFLKEILSIFDSTISSKIDDYNMKLNDQIKYIQSL